MLGIRKALSVLFLLLAGTTPWFQATAATTFGLSPMRADLSAAAPTAVITVNNGGEQPLTVQIQARSWQQADGRDEQAPSGDFILNPAMATIPPGGEQVIRIALRIPPDQKVERAYRLVVREVPLAPQEGEGLRMALAMDIPVFVAPLASEAVASPRFSIDNSGNTSRVRIANDGSRHLRLAGIVVSQGEHTLLEQGVLVILPRVTNYLRLPAPLTPAKGVLKLQAQSNIGPVDVVLSPAAP